MVSLVALVARAYDYMVSEWEIPREAVVRAREAAALAEKGFYRDASRIAAFDRPISDRGVFALLPWTSFAWVCELAERINSLLTGLEYAGPGKALARACREDLEGLAVLADWCEDAGLPWTASETRRLHDLVRQELRFREPLRKSSGESSPLLSEEDLEEYDSEME